MDVRFMIHPRMLVIRYICNIELYWAQRPFRKIRVAFYKVAVLGAVVEC
jgi:hypothetical protein